MKLAFIVAAAAQAKNSSWLKNEWEVQDAYFANEEIILSDPTIRKGSKRQYKISYNFEQISDFRILVFRFLIFQFRFLVCFTVLR